MLRPVLPAMLSVFVAVLVIGLACRSPRAGVGTGVSPTSKESVEPLPEPTIIRAVTPVPAAARGTSRQALTLTPMATASPASTPTVPVPTSLVAASCCGLITWVGSERLLVYDLLPEPGAWLVDVATGKRRKLAPWFGVSNSDCIAVTDPFEGVTTLFDSEGSVIDTVHTGRTMVALAPGCRFLAWLESENEQLPSSFIARLADIVVFDRATRHVYRPGQLRVSSLAWTGDGSQLLLLGEAADGTRAGIWRSVAPWTTLEVVVEGRFFANLQPVWGRSDFLVTRVLSPTPIDDGVWLIDPETGERRKIPIETTYRVTAGSICILRNEASLATVYAYRADDLQLLSVTHLAEPVLGDTWSVSPDGRWVAYWGATTRRIIVEPLASIQAER